jgi:hypothetical protein
MLYCLIGTLKSIFSHQTNISMSHLTIAFLSKEGRNKRQAREDEKQRKLDEAFAYYYVVEDHREGAILCLDLWKIHHTHEQLTSLSVEQIEEIIETLHQLSNGLRILARKLRWRVCLSKKARRYHDFIKQISFAITRGLHELSTVENQKMKQAYEFNTTIHWYLSQQSKHPLP